MEDKDGIIAATVKMQTARNEQTLYANQISELAEQVMVIEARKKVLFDLHTTARQTEMETMKFLISKGVQVD